jgi:hypothetical protein
MSSKTSEKRVGAFSLKIAKINESKVDKKNKQEALRKAHYDRALRYMAKAEDALKKANIDEDGFYSDKRYLKIAYTMAYRALLTAVDCYFILKGVEITDDTEKDIAFYRVNMARKNTNLYNPLCSAYEVLHFGALYSITMDSIIQIGFKHVKMFIDLIKPTRCNYQTNGKAKKICQRKQAIKD